MSKKNKAVNYKIWPKIVMAVASAVGAVSTFLPWFTAEFIGRQESVNLYEKIFDPLGFLLLVALIVIAGLSLASALSRNSQMFKITNILSIVISVLAGFAIIAVIAYYNNGASYMSSYDVKYGIGAGIILTSMSFIIDIIFSIYSPKE